MNKTCTCAEQEVECPHAKTMVQLVAELRGALLDAGHTDDEYPQRALREVAARVAPDTGSHAAFIREWGPNSGALRLLVWGFEKVPHGESTLPGPRCLHCVVQEAKAELEAGEALKKQVRALEHQVKAAHENAATWSRMYESATQANTTLLRRLSGLAERVSELEAKDATHEAK